VSTDSATEPAVKTPGLTRAEVATRAGVETAFVDRMCEVGILEAAEGEFSEGDMRRARILHSLDAAGLPLEAVGKGVRAGVVDLGFVDDPAYELFTGLTDETFQQVSQRTTIPMEVLSAIREATGSAPARPDDRIRALELETLPAVELQVRYGMRPAAIERTLRAWGDSMRRIADVEADMWMSDVLQPMFAAGGSFADIGPRTSDFSNALQPLGERLIIALYHGQQSNAWMRNFLGGFEAGLSNAGLYKPVEQPPAICFLDLSGYTRLTEERGDAVAADLAGRLSKLVQRTSARYGGKPIKWLGDGVMFHFRDPGLGVVAALEMVEGAREADLPPAHVGLHAGPVLFQDGDYFGRTVNVAARIADYARRGEVLVSADVVEATTDQPVAFDAIGPVELKGLSEAVTLYVAHSI
jgi:adenylate cyclase